MKELNAGGKKEMILLKTMGPEVAMSSFRISGIEVAGLGNATLIKGPVCSFLSNVLPQINIVIHK